MRKFGVFIFILGALCIVSGIVDVSYVGSQILKALNSFAVFLQGSSFGVKNTTLFLYGGIVIIIIGIAMLVFDKKSRWL